MSVLDSQASAINALGAPPNRRCPDRRCTLIGDKVNVVYAAVYNEASEVHRFHAQLSWRAIALSAPGQRWILAACEHAVRSDEELTPLAFAYQVESALTVNAIVDHN